MSINSERLEELASIQASLRAEIKEKADDLKVIRKYLKEVQSESDAIARDDLDLKCEPA